MQAEPIRSFRTDINGLRAFAVAAVVLFHIDPAVFRGGFVGVDVFFVISGYLMTRIVLAGLDRDRFSLLGFYRDRFARIVPALAATCLAVLAFGVAFVEPATLKETAQEVVGALAFVSNVQFWLGAGYFDSASQSKWLLHTWSLSVEWWFYIAYPILLIALRRWIATPRARYLLLAGLLLGSIAISAAAAMFPGRVYAFGFYMLPARAWEMLAGGLVAVQPDLFSRSPRVRHGLGWAGLALTAASLALLTEQTPWPGVFAALPVVGAAMILAARPSHPALDWKPVHLVGSWSYSIYLWHWPLIVALRYFDVHGPLFVATALIGALAFGALSYRLIELPAKDWLKRSPGIVRPGFALGLGGLLAAGAAVVVMTGGLQARIVGDHRRYEDALAASTDRLFQNDGCQAGLSPRTGKVRPCVIGISHPGRDVLVIGDSFAEQWFARAKSLEPGLTDHAVVFVTKGGCPPFPGVERLQPGLGCANFHRAAADEALKPQYASVIYASIWAAYFKHTSPELNVGGAEAVHRLSSEISALRSAGKVVSLVTTAPYPDADITARYRRLSFEGRDGGAYRPEFDFKTVIEASEPVDDMLKGLARDGITIIDTPHALCRGACPLFVDRSPIYADSVHLRSSYAAQVGGFLDAAFLERPSAPIIR